MTTRSTVTYLSAAVASLSATVTCLLATVTCLLATITCLLATVTYLVATVAFVVLASDIVAPSVLTEIALSLFAVTEVLACLGAKAAV